MGDGGRWEIKYVCMFFHPVSDDMAYAVECVRKSCQVVVVSLVLTFCPAKTDLLTFGKY